VPCYSPLQAYYSRSLNASGKRPIVFSLREAQDDRLIQVPCGQCIGCKLERSRQWAIRCVHEASLYENNCFLTLTYNDQHLPPSNSLQPTHFQKFMKRFRKHHGPNIRFFHCGEYGERYKRPHYHACIFNFDFNDKEIFKYEKTTETFLYTSKALEKLWPFGFSTVGELTFESAAYVARYVTKKITGKNELLKLFTYTDFDTATGEVLNERIPEYTTMSRRPGIGKPWLDKYLTDVYPHDFVVLKGKKMRPPKYYDNQLQKADPFEHDHIKERRTENAKAHGENNTAQRLDVREKLQLLKLKQLKRNLENET